MKEHVDPLLERVFPAPEKTANPRTVIQNAPV